MSETAPEIERIRSTLPEGSSASVVAGLDMPTVEAEVGEIADLCRALKESPETCYEMLTAVTAVDNLDEEASPAGENSPAGEEIPPRFEVVYHLLSLKRRQRARIRVRVAEGQPVPTVTGVWATANWHERETWDMFGIPFENHPDLRRLYMPEEYPYHPLRKEFPQEGIDPGQLYWKWFESRDKTDAAE